MRKIDGVRVLRTHTKGCLAIQPQNWPDNPLWMPGKEPLRLDAAGRKLRPNCFGSSWHSFQCNSNDCQAEVLIRADVLTKLAHDLMRQATGGRE